MRPRRVAVFAVAWALFTPLPAAAASGSYIWVGAPGKDSITKGQFVRYPHAGERIHAVHGLIGGAENALAIDVLDAAGRVVGTVSLSPPKGKAARSRDVPKVRGDAG